MKSALGTLPAGALAVAFIAASAPLGCSQTSAPEGSCEGASASCHPQPADAGESDAGATCHEGVSAATCAALAAIQLPSTLPPSNGNAHADDSNAALFGFHVFFDSRFSSNTNVRCETCHSVEHDFDDNLPTPTGGVGSGTRNAPTIFNAARYTSFMWDGRADSLWSQPLLALENPNEMAFTRLEIAHLLATLYAKEYATAFGPLPDMSDMTRFPARGAPGDPAFDAMAPADQETIDEVVANLGKALEAYMRHLATGPSPVDKYLAGDQTALTDTQVQGMYVFASAGCIDCHNGPQLSDGLFHNLGVAAAPGQAPDPGRSQGVKTLESSPFNAMGPFFDGAPVDMVPLTPVLGGFRTPSLRNLTGSAPYGHNGTFATLESIVDFHLSGGGSDPSGYVGDMDPLLKPHVLSDEDRSALLEFLRALDGQYPGLPWGQWPNGNG